LTLGHVGVVFLVLIHLPPHTWFPYRPYTVSPSLCTTKSHWLTHRHLPFPHATIVLHLRAGVCVCPEAGGSWLFRRVGKYKPYDTTSHKRRQYFSKILPWEPQSSHIETVSYNPI